MTVLEGEEEQKQYLNAKLLHDNIYKQKIEDEIEHSERKAGQID
jgi:hypothetical protein